MTREELSVKVRMGREMIEAVDLAVKMGVGMNRSDLIRAAVSEKLERLSVYEEMKKRLRPRD
jgi:Arc/MetJ-type ribon-helix-helix transcriptional regulator